MNDCIPISWIIIFLDSITISISVWMIIDVLRHRKRDNELQRYCKEQGFDKLYIEYCKEQNQN
jgi:hypothetical protein